MADRREDISVRIAADYAKALADIQRFTGLTEKAFERLPKAVQHVTTAIDTMSARAAKAGADLTRMTGMVHTGFDGLPRVIQALSGSVDQLTQRIARMGQLDGPNRLQQRLRQTDDEARRLNSTFDKLLQSGRAIGAAMAAWQAGKAVLEPVVANTMDYNMRLAQATNISALGASNAEKFKAETAINASLQDARHTGGGTREGLLTAFELLMARNVIGNQQQTLATMPGIAKTATAGAATPEQIAHASAGLIRSLGVLPKDNELALARLFYSGQDGGYELKNMAHYLPAQAGSAKLVGMTGLPTVSKLAAGNQLAVDFSGTPDQAGVNFTDFMAGLSSNHLSKHLQRFSYEKESNTLIYNNNKRKGKNYIDIQHVAAANAEKGIDAIETMIQITDMVSRGDPKYQEAIKKRDAVKGRLEAAKKSGDSDGQMAAQQELLAISNSVVQILQGRGLAKIFGNQQEMRGGLGILTNPDLYHAKVKEYDTQGTIDNRDNALDFIKLHPAYKAQMYEQDKNAALYTGMEGFNGWLGKMADGASALYEKYPVLASAMEGGKVAVLTMGAAAGGAAVALALLTRNAGIAAAAQGGPGGGPGGGPPGASPGVGKNFMTGLKYGGPLAVALASLEAYGISANTQLTDQEKKIGYSGAAGGAVGGALGGAAAGALAGSVVPGIGTIIGGVIGALIGSWAGKGAGTAVGESMFGDPKLSAVGTAQTFSENFALRKQLARPDAATEATQRALMDRFTPKPVEMRGKIEVSFDNTGNPYVKKQDITTNGIRLDTGPMMTY